MKECKYCGNEYPEDYFEVANVIKGKAYRRLKCKFCKNKTQRKRLRKIRKMFLEIKEQMSCERCGFDDYRALDFHHTNPEEKDFAVGDALRYGYSLERIKKEMKKCEVICANCHRIEHFIELGD